MKLLKSLLISLGLIFSFAAIAQTPIGSGTLKSTIVGTEYIPVSGTGHPVISPNMLVQYGRLTPTLVKNSAYTAVAGDFIPVDASAASVTITLPTTPVDKTQIGVKMVTVSGSFTTTIARGGSDVFNKTGGATSLTLTTLNQEVVLQYKATGAIWYVIAENPSGGGGGGTWGSITGTLSSQTDLNSALNGKQPLATPLTNFAALSNSVGVLTNNGSGTLSWGALSGSNPGLNLTRTSVKTSSYTAGAGELIPTDATSGIVAITLPTAPADKTTIFVKQVLVTAPTFYTSITAGGSDVFNRTGGSTTFNMTLLAQAVLLQYTSSGGIWTVISDDLSLSQLDLRFANLVSPTFTGTPTAPTASPGTSNNQVSTTAYVDNATAKYERIGDIYNETFSSLTAYTNVGSASASASAGTLTVSGGSGSFANYLYRTSVYTCLDWQYRQVTFSSTVNGASGSNEGLGIGWRGRNAGGGLESVIATFNTAAVTNRGQVLIRNVDFSGTITTVATSGSNLSYTNGDIITMKVVYNNAKTAVYVVNVTTGTSISAQYTSAFAFGSVSGIIDVSAPALYLISGTQLITNDVWGTDNVYQPTIIHVGNSITIGGLSGNPSLGWMQLAASYINGRSWIDAASVNGTQDVINSFNDLVIAKPKFVTLYLGTNDAVVYALSVGTTTTAGTHLYYMQQIINLCITNGIQPIILYSLPASSSYAGFATYNTKINAYNSAYAAAFPGVPLIDVTTGLVSGGNMITTMSADGLHPNAQTHTILMTNFLNGISPYVKVTRPLISALGAAGKVNWDENLQQFTIGTTNKAYIAPDYTGAGEFSNGVLYASALGDFNFFANSTSGAAGAKVNIGYYNGSQLRSAINVSNVASGFSTLNLMPSGGSIVSGAPISAPNVAIATTNATDANFTAVVNTSKHLPAGTLTANRTITIPTGAEGNVIRFANQEKVFTWLLAGVSVYYSDESIATSLLGNANYWIEYLDGKWRIFN